MKKILSAAALFLTLPVLTTGCSGDRDNMSSESGHFEEYDYGNHADGSAYDDDKHDSDAEDFAHDAINGAESAADDVIEGAGDAANDIIDGLDGERETDVTSTKNDDSTTTTVTVEKRGR